MRNPLGMRLDNILQPKQFPMTTPPIAPAPRVEMNMEKPKQGFLAPGSKGAMIAGILGDALAGAVGRPATFTQNMMAERQREQAMEAAEAQWTRNRQSQLADKATDRANDMSDWRAKQEWERANPAPSAPSPILRDATAWLGMTPEQRQAYQQMQRARPQFIPDGYGGGSWATPPSGSAPPATLPADFDFGEGTAGNGGGGFPR